MERKFAEPSLPTSALLDVSDLESSCGEGIAQPIEENSSAYTFFQSPMMASQFEKCTLSPISLQNSKSGNAPMDEADSQIIIECEVTGSPGGCLDSNSDSLIINSSCIAKSSKKNGIELPMEGKRQGRSNVAFSDRSKCFAEPLASQKSSSTGANSAMCSSDKITPISSSSVSSSFKNQEHEKINCFDDGPEVEDIHEKLASTPESGADFVDVLLLEDSTYPLREQAAVHHKPSRRTKLFSIRGRHIIRERIYPSIVDEDWEESSFISPSRYELYIRNQSVKKNHGNLLSNRKIRISARPGIMKPISHQEESPLVLPSTPMLHSPNSITSGNKLLQDAHEDLCKELNRENRIENVKSNSTLKTKGSTLLPIEFNLSTLHQRKVSSISCGTANTAHTLAFPEFNATSDIASKTPDQNQSRKSDSILKECDSSMMSYQPLIGPQTNDKTAVKIDLNCASTSSGNASEITNSMQQTPPVKEFRSSAVKMSTLGMNSLLSPAKYHSQVRQVENSRLTPRTSKRPVSVESKVISTFPYTTEISNNSSENNLSTGSNSSNVKKYKILLPSGNNTYRWASFSLPTDSSPINVSSLKNCSLKRKLSSVEEIQSQENVSKSNKETFQSTELKDICAMLGARSQNIRFATHLTRSSPNKSTNQVHPKIVLKSSTEMCRGQLNNDSKFANSNINIKLNVAHALGPFKAFKSKQSTSCLHVTSDEHSGNQKTSSVYGKERASEEDCQRSGNLSCNTNIADCVSVKNSNSSKNSKLENEAGIQTKNNIVNVMLKCSKVNPKDKFNLQGISKNFSIGKTNLYEQANRVCVKVKTGKNFSDIPSRAIVMRNLSPKKTDWSALNPSALQQDSVCITSPNMDKDSRLSVVANSLTTHNASKLQPFSLNDSRMHVEARNVCTAVSVKDATCEEQERVKNTNNFKHSSVGGSKVIPLTFEQVEHLCDSYILYRDQQTENRKEIQHVPATYCEASLFPQDCSDVDCASNMEFAVQLPGNDAIMPSAEAEQISTQFFPNTVRSFADISNGNDCVILSSSDQLIKKATGNQRQSHHSDDVIIQSLSDELIMDGKTSNQSQTAMQFLVGSPAASSVQTHPLQVLGACSLSADRTMHNRTQIIPKGSDNSNSHTVKGQSKIKIFKRNTKVVSTQTDHLKKNGRQSCSKNFFQIPKICLNQDIDTNEDEIVDVNSYCEEDCNKIRAELLKAHSKKPKKKKFKSAPPRVSNTLTNKKLWLGHVSTELDSVVANLNYEISLAKREVCSSSDKSSKARSLGSVAPTAKTVHHVVQHFDETKFKKILGAEERLLKEIFFFEPHPPSNLVSTLAKALNRSWRKLQNWFAAARAYRKKMAVSVRRHYLERCRYCAKHLPSPEAALHHIFSSVHLRRALRAHNVAYLREVEKRKSEGCSLDAKTTLQTNGNSLQSSSELSRSKLNCEKKTTFSSSNETAELHRDEATLAKNCANQHEDTCVFLEEISDRCHDQEEKVESGDNDEENLDIESWEEDPLLDIGNVHQAMLVSSQDFELDSIDDAQLEDEEVVVQKWEQASQNGGFDQTETLPRIVDVRTITESSHISFDDLEDSVLKQQSHECGKQISVGINGIVVCPESDAVKVQKYVDQDAVIATHTGVEEEFASTKENCVDGIQKSTYAIEKSTGAVETSTGAVETSTGAAETSTGAAETSTGAAETSTGAVETSTGAVETSTGAVETSTGAAETSTGAAETSIGAAETSTGAAETSTGAVETSTGAVETSTGAVETSAGADKKSIDAKEKSADSGEKSTCTKRKSSHLDDKSVEIPTKSMDDFGEYLCTDEACTPIVSFVEKSHYLKASFAGSEKEFTIAKKSSRIGEEQSHTVREKFTDDNSNETLEKVEIMRNDGVSDSDSWEKSVSSGVTIKCENITIEVGEHLEVVDRTSGCNLSKNSTGTNAYDNCEYLNVVKHDLTNPKKSVEWEPHFSKESSALITENSDETLERSKRLADHSKIILGYECPICVKIFQSDWALLRHSLSHQTFMCAHCTEKFPNEVVLRSHLLSHVKTSVNCEDLRSLMCSCCRSLSCVCAPLKRNESVIGKHRLQRAKRSKTEFVTERIVSPFEGYRLSYQQFLHMNLKSSIEVRKPKIMKRLSSSEDQTSLTPKRLKPACSGQIINNILKSDSDVSYSGDDVLLHHNRTCQLCGESFDNKSQLDEHMFLHRLKGRNRRGMKRSKEDNANDTATKCIRVEGQKVVNKNEKYCATNRRSTSNIVIAPKGNCSDVENIVFSEKSSKVQTLSSQKAAPRYQMKCFFCQKIMKREQELRIHMKFKCSQAPKRSIKKLLGAGKTLMCLAAEGHGKLYDIVDTLTMQILEDCILLPDATTAPPATNTALGKLVPKCKFCSMKFERVREVRRHIQNICHKVSKHTKKRIEEGATLEEVDAVELCDDVLTKRMKDHFILYREGPEDAGRIEKASITDTEINSSQRLRSVQDVKTKESQQVVKKLVLQNDKPENARSFSLGVESKFEVSNSSFSKYLQTTCHSSSFEDDVNAEFDGFAETSPNNTIASLQRESRRLRENTRRRAQRSKILRLRRRKKALVKAKRLSQGEISCVRPICKELKVVPRDTEDAKWDIVGRDDKFSIGLPVNDKMIAFNVDKNNMGELVENVETNVVHEISVTGNTEDQNLSDIQEGMHACVQVMSSSTRTQVHVSNPMTSYKEPANVVLVTSESSRSDHEVSCDQQSNYEQNYPALSTLHQSVEEGENKSTSDEKYSSEPLLRIEDIRSLRHCEAEFFGTVSSTGSGDLNSSDALGSANNIASQALKDSPTSSTEIVPPMVDGDNELLDISDGMYCGIVVEDLKAEDFGGVECEMELLETSCTEDRDASDDELVIDCDDQR